jgi:hypothetical protein
MTDLPDDTHDKYITFKRSEFYELMGELALPPWKDPEGSLVGTEWDCAPIAQTIKQRAEAVELVDAVVIRRRDLFASPCLATYANMIALVAHNITDLDQGNELLAIADYFEQQASLAADEGTKLPTI